jgi:hypothetical protein
MARYILRYRGAGPCPERDVELIAALPGVEVLDESPRMLLVDATEEDLRTTIADLRGWVMSAETAVPLPDVRRRPRHRSRS